MAIGDYRIIEMFNIILSDARLGKASPIRLSVSPSPRFCHHDLNMLAKT